MNQNTLIVFDIDGTLTDSVLIHQTAFKYALNEFGFTNYDTNFGSYLHHTDSYIFSEIFRKQRNYAPGKADISSFEELVLKKIQSDLEEKLIQEIPGATDFITALQKSGYDIVYATGSVTKPAQLKLEHIGITVNENLLISSNNIHSREELVNLAIERAGKFYQKNYEKIISIGDGLWDLKTANNLNIDFVGIANEKLIEFGASAVYINFTEPGIHHHFDLPVGEDLFPDFIIQPVGQISSEFLKRRITTFKEAAEWVRQLPYGRNNNKDSLVTLFSDNCGTCSTKHALLKKLCLENNFQGIELVIGLFKMNGKNTPEVSTTLRKHGLEFIPEAHNYLKYYGKIIDCTKPTFNPSEFVDDLIEELTIMPDQISSFKVEYHKNYLKNWLRSNSYIKMTDEELWTIREACIKDLASN
jgi:phosphoglycolate phosphatase-like HAD superfamily hydrolase